ncbi:MAG: type II toxin-antitoxin system YafQ family toxin [Candidatus Scalinduaceae bacterium]
MTEIAFSSSFKKSFKKTIKSRKKLEDRFWKKVKVFIRNPFDEQLRTHKLSGKLKKLWSFTIEYDVRVIFYFAGKGKVIFVDIGKHDEIY